MVRINETGGTVHVVQRMDPGGIETLILDMIRAEDNPADRVYSLEADVPTLLDEWPPLAEFRDQLVGFDRGEGLSPKLVREIAAQMRVDQPRTVITHHIGPLIYGASAARLARVPHIIYVEHDVWHYDSAKARIYTRLAARLCRPHFVAVSHPIAEGMRPIIGDKPVHVIPPAIDTRRFVPGSKAEARALLAISKDVSLVGSAGRLEQVKAYDVLIDAIALLPEKVHLVLAGDGSQRQVLEQQAKDRGLQERVHFLGMRGDLEKIMPALDVFCLSSHNEGLPRVVLEAQSSGVPVVATDVGAMRDAVCPDSGRIVPPGDAEALAEGLRAQLAAKISTEGARRFVVERYGLDSLMQAFHKVVEDA